MLPIFLSIKKPIGRAESRVSKKVAISQSNYIPWKGYFDLIASVDEFILFDDVQYTRRDWRNRNLIQTPTGPKWLTVPVQVKNKYDQSIYDTRINDEKWALKHLKTLEQFYSRTAYFPEITSWLRPVYCDETHTRLSALNARLIGLICKYLGITTPILQSRDFTLKNGKNERLIGLCRDVDANTYVSGPAAKDYLDEELFGKSGVAVEWFSYGGYSPYPQTGGNFNHYVTILDLLFHTGPNARDFMKH